MAPTGHIDHEKQDKAAKKYVDTSNKIHDNIETHKPAGQKPDAEKEKKQPAGGFDDTQLPSAPPGYTLKFTFHSAKNLPFADVNSLSSDPYIKATLQTNLAKRHKQDPEMVWRTPTVHRNCNPVWNSVWIVANVPSTGFDLKCRLYDEDPADHDDRLGNVSVRIDSISEQWSGINQLAYKIKKRMGSKRAYLVRGCAAMFEKGLEMSGEVVISVELLGRTESDQGAHLYTVGPDVWTRHFSPLIGRLTGTKDGRGDKDGQNHTDKYNFQAVQIQLSGPVPPPLYHRYVEFKPFVAGMFTSHSLRGRFLNHALHHQHARIYSFDRSTVYGSFAEPCTDMTKQFLDFVHYDQGGRIFTYVLTLDGQWRFTETGKEFGIDMLSKHTMHSDVSIYIAFSGEFFIRRLKHPHANHSDSPDPKNASLPPAPEPEEERPASASQPSKDPAMYELVIDNDSGTYRPNAKYLHTLKEFMAKNLVGMRVVTLDCQADEEKMTKLKDEQRAKKKADGKHMTYLQNASDASISSSDEQRLDDGSKGGKAKQLGQRLKNPKATFMSAAANAAGPTSAAPHANGEQSDQHSKEPAGTSESPESEKPLVNGSQEPEMSEKQT